MDIMVHELGHLIFGLPDLYDTDYCAIRLNISSFSIKAFPNSLAPVTLKCVSSTNKRVPSFV
jgi:hypothetical protein